MTNDFVKLVTVWCTSLLLMNIFYMAFAYFEINIDSVDDKSDSCIVIGVFLHYFLLTSFCLSLIISIAQYIILNRNYFIIHNLLIKSVAASSSKVF